MQSATVAPAAAPRQARRNYLIDRSFQLKYTLIMVVVGAAISLLFGAMMYQAHLETMQLMSLPESLRATVAAQDATLLGLVLAISLVMALALGLVGVLITHRIAGPIYVFSHYIALIGEGRFPRIRPLRRGDELKGFHDVFEHAVARMRERETAEGKALQEIAASLDGAAARGAEDAEALRLCGFRLRELSSRKLEAAAGDEPSRPSSSGGADKPAA
jgi:hypothetical protein